MANLTFLSWAREKIADLATGTDSGRAHGQTAVTLTGTDAAGAVTTTATRTLPFLLAGPADVTGLLPGAVSARYPVPGALDAESDKATHVELVEPTLPWRYSVAGNPPAGSGALHPWLALIVGLEGSELTLAGDRVTLSPVVQALHPLGDPFPWVHVQIDDAGRRVARVLSARPLDGGQEYLAVLVPAFNAGGTLPWSGAGAVTLPLYDHWRFRTAVPPGGFRDLAARLQPGEADPETGRAPLDYPRLPAEPDLAVRGAMAPLDSMDPPLPQAVRDDLGAIATPATDPQGRPVIGLPRYGDAWHADPESATWGDTANRDPRHRGVAGVGLEIGVLLQEELAAEAQAHAGALAVARQRISHLSLGLAAADSLWRRRLPSDPVNRLWMLGPALRRVVTPDGTVEALATAEDRALPRGIFSSSVRRMLRPGPARTATLSDGPPQPAAILAAANRCPPERKPTEDGVALGDAGAKLEQRLEAVLGGGELDFEHLHAVLEGIDLERVPGRARPLLGQIRDRLLDSIPEAAPWGPALALFAWALRLGPGPDDREVPPLLAAISELLARWDELAAEPDELLELLEGLREPPASEPPCRRVDVEALAVGAAATFDPTGADGAARVRVLAGIDGLDPAQPLAPPEVCVGLDRPVWRDLERTFPEWLLPGVGALPEDRVIALETNPRFTDALLLGYNGQLLGELRWRNLPFASGCTPLRVFWERSNTSSGARVDDIVGIASWTSDSGLGDPSHRPDGAAGRDLVVVVRGQLFLRYPRTLVYLVSAEHDGAIDFDADPAPGAPHLLPSFQGRVGTDVMFFGFQGVVPTDVARHFVVFEEPPAGYRFYNVAHATVPAGADGAAFADAAFADPIRVLIRGDSLLPGGSP